MDIVMPRRVDCAFDLRLWPTVRAHRVQGYDAWHGVAALAGFLDIQNLTAFVIAALGAGTMWHLALVAVRTFRECMALKRVMGAPASGACFRVSPFWIWHLDSFLINVGANRPRSCAAAKISLPTCCEDLSAVSNADLLSVQRKSIAPSSDSCRNADKNPCSPRGRSLSEGALGAPARAPHLRAANPQPDSS